MKFINTSDLADPGWDFIASYSDNPDITWEYHLGTRRAGVEKWMKRPHLGRMRADFTAARSAARQPGSALVSHLPNMTFVTARAQNYLGKPGPHVGFSFNFTDLPKGKRKSLYKETFKNMTEFVVFSKYEVDLYEEYFGISKENLKFLPWTMDRPNTRSNIKLPFDGDYLCAVGSEARDYGTLMAAMQTLPHINLVLIARHHSLAGITVPENVRVMIEIPSAHVWAIAEKSKGMVVPLQTDKTPNGHVTIVGTRLMAVPLAVSRSDGISDYVHDDDSFMFQSGNAEELRTALLVMMTQQDLAARKAALAQRRALEQNDVKHWVAYFDDLNRRLSAFAT
ncbi:hypothetical protein ACOI1H_17475 [Loktanella sp. DJP18]|uniref:hypothetical protein n=1 Tax=Loktanella sp. DJP18 TaxID=3409788 RepID=UPI003BB67C8B